VESEVLITLRSRFLGVRLAHIQDQYPVICLDTDRQGDRWEVKIEMWLRISAFAHVPRVKAPDQAWLGKLQ
jgi:hypothetical protein